MIITVILIALAIFLFTTQVGWTNVFSQDRNDLVFEGRNHEYGAYRLRRNQSANLMTALLVVIGLVGTSGWMAVRATTSLEAPIEISDDDGTILPPPNIIESQKITVKPPIEKSKVVTVKTTGFTEIEVVDSVETSLKSVDQLRNKSLGGFGDDDGEDGLVRPIESGGGSGDGPCVDCETKLEEEVIPDRLAQFPGGENALAEFLQLHVPYDRQLADMGVEGTIYLSVRVSSDGSLSDARIDRGIVGGANLEKKALKSTTMMPNWIPGVRKNKPVTSRVTIPLKFVLKD